MLEDANGCKRTQVTEWFGCFESATLCANSLPREQIERQLSSSQLVGFRRGRVRELQHAAKTPTICILGAKEKDRGKGRVIVSCVVRHKWVAWMGVLWNKSRQRSALSSGRAMKPGNSACVPFKIAAVRRLSDHWIHYIEVRALPAKNLKRNNGMVHNS